MDGRLIQALSETQQTLRQSDYARYTTTLFAPSRLRPAMVALYGLNFELASAHDRSSEALIGAMRLQWWRETLELLKAGKLRAHPLVLLLDWTRQHFALDLDALAAIIDPRERDMDEEAFADLADATAYARATSGRLLMIGAGLVTDDPASLARAEAIGTAHGLHRLDQALGQGLAGAFSLFELGREPIMDAAEQGQAIEALRAELRGEIARLRRPRQRVQSISKPFMLIDCDIRAGEDRSQHHALRLLTAMARRALFSRCF